MVFRFYSNLIFFFSLFSSSSDFLASCDAGDLLRGNGRHVRLHGAHVLQPGRAALGGARVVRRAGANVPGARLRGSDAEQAWIRMAEHPNYPYSYPLKM